MKTLFLMRHAKAASDSPTYEDRDRALNARGNQDAPGMAAIMKARGYVPDLILCSSARRTQETCRHILNVLGPDIPVTFEAGLYLATDDEILSIVRTAGTAKSVLVIAHNPGIEELAMALAKGEGPPKFPTAAFAVFTFDVDNWKDIKPGTGKFTDYLTPKNLGP